MTSMPMSISHHPVLMLWVAGARVWYRQAARLLRKQYGTMLRRMEGRLAAALAINLGFRPGKRVHIFPLRSIISMLAEVCLMSQVMPILRRGIKSTLMVRARRLEEPALWHHYGRVLLRY